MRGTAALKRRIAELEAELRSAETRAREIDHRAKNSLQLAMSLLLLQARRVGEASAAAILQDACERLRVLAELHAALSGEDSDESVELKALLEKVCAAARLYAGGRVKVDLDCPGLSAPPETASALGLLANEAVTNALKHAFPAGRPGLVAIRIADDGDGGWVLAIRDDGVGLGEARPGLGFTLMDMLAGRLDGRCERSSEADHGTEIRVPFHADLQPDPEHASTRPG